MDGGSAEGRHVMIVTRCPRGVLMQFNASSAQDGVMILLDYGPSGGTTGKSEGRDLCFFNTLVLNTSIADFLRVGASRTLNSDLELPSLRLQH